VVFASENSWIIIFEKYFYGALITKSIHFFFIYKSCANIMEASYWIYFLFFFCTLLDFLLLDHSFKFYKF
jgi:hypothetical protein